MAYILTEYYVVQYTPIDKDLTRTVKDLKENKTNVGTVATLLLCSLFQTTGEIKQTALEHLHETNGLRFSQYICFRH